MILFDKLSFWFIVGALFFVGFGVIAVTGFLAGAPAFRRKKRREPD